MTLLIF